MSGDEVNERPGTLPGGKRYGVNAKSVWMFLYLRE